VVSHFQKEEFMLMLLSWIFQSLMERIPWIGFKRRNSILTVATHRRTKRHPFQLSTCKGRLSHGTIGLWSWDTEGWEEFVVTLKVRFAPSACDDPIGAFTKLIQTATMEEYQSEFEALSNRISDLNEEFRVHTFLSGLKEEIRIMITILKPNCLSVPFGLAQL